MPLVSVIIPCFNHGIYLAESVESVLDSDFDDFEILVIDDGSADAETCAILDAFSYPKTTVVRQNNTGPSMARNHAITIARGKYILPLDADDRIGPGYIRQAVKILEAEADVGIVYCRGQKFGEQEGLIMAPPFSIMAMRFSNLIFCTAMFRRADWELSGGYSPEMIYGNEDWEFWCSLLELGRRVVRIPEVAFWYRIRSKSRNSRMGMERHIAMHRLIVSRHPSLFPKWFSLLLPVYYRLVNSVLYRLLKRSGLPGKVLS